MTFSTKMFFHYGECNFLFTIMLNDIMLSVVILNIVMLSVVMLSIVKLNAVELSVVKPSVIMLGVVMVSFVTMLRGVCLFHLEEKKFSNFVYQCYKTLSTSTMVTVYKSLT